MSKGISGLFNNTKGRRKRNHFKLIHFAGSVKVNGSVRNVGRKVYQRSDIDFYLFDAVTGLTNLERMQKGKPPIGNDGSPIQLHHVIQKENGPVVEIRESTHQKYYHTLHGLIERGSSFRNNPDANKQYINFRTIYWKWRAQKFMEELENEQ